MKLNESKDARNFTKVLAFLNYTKFFSSPRSEAALLFSLQPFINLYAKTRLRKGIYLKCPLQAEKYNQGYNPN